VSGYTIPMDAIDKGTREFIEATDAMVIKDNEAMENPSTDAPVQHRRKRPDEVIAFLKQNTLGTLERLHSIATDSLYMRDNEGKRQRVPVPVGVQLQASIAFLDRAMGKPQVSVDLTSGDRPIMFDASFAHKPLVQATIESIDNGDDRDLDSDSIDT
jgi:hypothetical protein